MISDPAPTLYDLLMMLRTGGTLIADAGCSTDEFIAARREGRMFVDEDGFGYVYKPKERKP